LAQAPCQEQETPEEEELMPPAVAVPVLLKHMVPDFVA